MCGIAGFFDFKASASNQELLSQAKTMGDAVRHRGPDGRGEFADASAGLGLAHRRLAIIDLTECGAQPMSTPDGRYTIVFNGEIYNFRSLRRRAEDHGYAFGSQSDTEALLACFSLFGVRQTLADSVGMFALALWDAKERRLVLARDRMGEKPLYYGMMGGSLLFGSELKALRAHPNFEARLNPEALAWFLRRHYTPAPLSIYQNVHKLPPGTTITVCGPTLGAPEPYWSLSQTLAEAMASPFQGSEDEALDALDGLLRDVVRNQMISDAPLGAFLSGGIDSSLVTAMMQRVSANPVRTFTIGFNEPGWDEAQEAAKVAKHLGTDHTTLTASPAQALEIVERLPDVYDEPFSDASQIPTYLVSKLTREHVTVSLSGDGGDEIFAGYNRHALGPGLWKRMSRLPTGIRKPAGFLLERLSPAFVDKAYGLAEPLLPESLRMRLPADKLAKVANLMSAGNFQDVYASAVANWPDSESLLLSRPSGATAWRAPDLPDAGGDLTLWMQAMDAATYLPDDIMAKVDRASMAVSLETRAPFLDHRVVRFGFSLPLELRVRNGKGKRLLRRLLSRYVPAKLIERPKMGFGVPLDQWLRGPLRPWAEDLLSTESLKRWSLLNPTPIQAAWREHLSGKRNHQYRLWSVLMLQAWLARWM
jgi:asparagine synthase (glutamine-hydrolysing)